MRALITTDTIGGVWTFTQELTQQLIARGWAICLVSLGGRPTAAQSAWCEEMSTAYGSSFHYDALDVPLEWMPQNERAWAAAAPWLMEKAEVFGAEIVHANQFCFGALPLPIPIVVTAHSDVLSWARACGRTLEDTPWLRTYVCLVGRGLESASAVAAPTLWMARSLEHDFPLCRQAAVIPNGRSLAPGSTRPRKPQAVTAGRLWDEAKNIRLLKELHSPVPLLIAGATAMHGEKAAGFCGNATQLGPLAPAELHTLFRESAIYICPSHYEPFGLAPLEAAQCGCALLMHDIPSLREVWQDSAFYFRSAAELTGLLQRLCGDPELLARARTRAGQRARIFSAERMADGYETLFHGLISRSQKEKNEWHAACA